MSPCLVSGRKRRQFGQEAAKRLAGAKMAADGICKDDDDEDSRKNLPRRAAVGRNLTIISAAKFSKKVDKNKPEFPLSISNHVSNRVIKEHRKR